MNLATLIADWRERRAATREFNGLGSDERDALARDLGLSQDELSQLATCRAAAGQELIRLMDALSLDPGEIERLAPGILRDLQVVCAGCRSSHRCNRQLDTGRAEATFEGYCPNAETLVALARFLSGALGSR